MDAHLQLVYKITYHKELQALINSNQRRKILQKIKSNWWYNQSILELLNSKAQNIFELWSIKLTTTDSTINIVWEIIQTKHTFKSTATTF